MNTTHDGKQDAEKSPERLEKEVDQTRARIDQRLDTLSSRLSPGELLDQALHMAKDHGGEFGHNLGTQVKQNPLPLILTGVGISWMMMSNNRPGPVIHTYGSDTTSGGAGGSRVGSGLSSAKDKLHDTAHRTSDHAHDMKSSAAERVSGARDSMQHRAQFTQQQFSDFFQQQPVLAGSLGVALGAALGALLPNTEAEHKALGSTSEQAVSKAKAEASKQYEKAQGTAKEALNSAKETVKEKNSGSSSSSTSSTGY